MLKIGKIFLQLLPNSLEYDIEIVKAVATNTYFDGWSVGTWNHHEKPKAYLNPIVKHLRDLSSIFYWRHRLWETHWIIKTTPLSQYNAAYYANAITNIKMEAEILGSFSEFDGEPYGTKTPQASFKTDNITEGDCIHLRQTIENATLIAGKVTTSKPCCSSNLVGYQWLMGLLGEEHQNTKTYMVTHPNYDIPSFIIPEGFELDTQWWGCDADRLPVEEIKKLEEDKILEIYPNCKGLMIHMSQNIPAKIREFG